MEPYYDFKGDPHHLVAVEPRHSTSSVQMHKHAFYEFVLLIKGSCVHRYGGQDFPLVPGDVFIVPPHHSHGFIIEKNLSVYNVQFYPGEFSRWWGDLRDAGSASTQHPYGNTSPSPLHEAEQSNHSMSTAQDENLSTPSMLRLSTSEADNIRGILDMMLSEQQHSLTGFDRVLQAYLEIILVMLSRVRTRQAFEVNTIPNPKKQAMRDILEYLESHLSEPIDFSVLAKKVHFSQNYFRTVFKDATGLSPVNYVNRMRIVKSLQYLRDAKIPISQVAEMVGIDDPNYFSRLFKRIVGYSPKDFKGFGE